jgi:GT2 family glycosyltransferase
MASGLHCGQRGVESESLVSIRRIAVLMTSFNRCESTLRSLAALTRQQRAADFTLQVFLVDDGSTDGTADAVQSAFPEIRILQGDGSLFWNGGMRMAFAAALQESFDAYVLLNDDTVLYNGAIARLVACVQMRVEAERPVIAVGSTVSPQTGEHTYGGIMKHVHGAVIRFDKIPPHECLPIPCDAMNGNVVLIPREIADVVGNLDKRFRHQFGDLDYALRAKRAGFQVMVAPGYLGECASNSKAGTWRDSSLSLRKRWKHLLSPKGIPVQEWFFFTSRHYGWRAMYYAFSPFVQTIVSSMLSHVGAGATRRESRPAS